MALVFISSLLLWASPFLKTKNTTDLGYSVYRDYSEWFEKRESKVSVQNLPQLQTTKIKKGRRANVYINISVCDNVKLLQGNCRLHSITSHLFSKYRQTLPKCHSLSSFQTKHDLWNKTKLTWTPQSTANTLLMKHCTHLLLYIYNRTTPFSKLLDSNSMF